MYFLKYSLFESAGHSLLSPKKIFVAIEKVVVCEFDDAGDLSTFFACFYVLNMEYNEKALALLVFIQRQLSFCFSKIFLQCCLFCFLVWITLGI